ncbi:MAG: DNA polymerase III subunit epsilon [Actinobacteria bacterium]|nr:DNA polymerase III subunit epsilon [Actinomycetota bacterium]
MGGILSVGGYTVIDLETTGLSPRQHDRIVEIAAVYVSENGQIEGEWTTLVNPGRDVGPTSLHGIRAKDVLDAPAFADIAPHVLRSVTGRTIVAHNSRFDTGFLAAEFIRVGVPLGVLPLPSLCTMQWAPKFLSAQSRRLVDCCAAAGIQLQNAHSALGDARATAQLLSVYLMSCGTTIPWLQVSHECSCYVWPTYNGALPNVPMVRRSTTQDRKPDAWLDRIVSRLPRVNEGAGDSYLEVLGRALVDQYLSVHEQTALLLLAEDLGLGREQVHEFHVRYLRAMAAVALQDGVVTAQERGDLDQVAACLGLAPDEVSRSLAIESPTASVSLGTINLRPGDRVVITGDTHRTRDEWIDRLLEAGLEHGVVTKATRVLVAADPDSLSGKAKKARDYGIPVITEAAFERIFDDYCVNRSN